jgi:hypothetical protein
VFLTYDRQLVAVAKLTGFQTLAYELKAMHECSEYSSKRFTSGSVACRACKVELQRRALFDRRGLGCIRLQPIQHGLSELRKKSHKAIAECDQDTKEHQPLAHFEQ